MFLEKAARNYLPRTVQRGAQEYMRNIRFVVLCNRAQIDKNIFTGQEGSW